MKRFLVSALMLGVFGLVTGCAEETKMKEETKVSTPTGSETTTKETKVEKTGDAKTNP